MAKKMMNTAKQFLENYGDAFINAGSIYCVLAGIIIVLFNFVLMLSLVPSGSMESTIMTNDIIIGTRYDKTDIERYDIMVFHPLDEPDQYYIKRVIGLPGETICVHEGKVYANGMELEDSFINEPMTTSGDCTYNVPKDSYFMLGDNRNHSLDSRFWDEKHVPIENMVAKARFIAFPFTHIGSLNYEAEAPSAQADVVSEGDSMDATHEHNWEPVNISHDELGHYEVVYQTLAALRCDECGEIFYNEDLFKAHLADLEDDCDTPQFTKVYYKAEACKTWIVDTPAWDEIIGCKCTVCGTHGVAGLMLPH